MLIPYELMYRLGFAPWERRPVASTSQRLTEGPGALPPGGTRSTWPRSAGR